MDSIVAEHVQPASRVLGLKPVQWIMLAILGMAIGYGGWSLRGSLTPAVSIAEARQHAGTVQVFGFLYSKGAYDSDMNWTFDIQDSHGQTMTVVYPTKPGNFEDAISVSATGRYDSASGLFKADQLLVKCPSKYQEQQAAQAQ